MSEEKDNRACCACLNVAFHPIRNEDGSYTERWACKDCGNEFVKKQRLSQAEAENQVLRDENVAYNKNYLKLMDVAGRMNHALERALTVVPKHTGIEDKIKACLIEWEGTKQ